MVDSSFVRSPVTSLASVLVTGVLWLLVLWRIASLNLVHPYVAVGGAFLGWILTIGAIGYLAETRVEGEAVAQ